MRIAIDAMGGDFAPKVIIEGAISSLGSFNDDDQLVLIGKNSDMLDTIRSLDFPSKKVEMVNADEVILMSDHPTRSLSQKPNSSIAIGFKLLKEGNVDAFCSAGNTGAMMVGALFSLGTMNDIQRPPIAGFFPLIDGGYSIMLDIGANADCKPEVLNKFAELGSLYAKFTLNINDPKVGLLNIGEEEEKGSTVTQAAYQLLKVNKKINFVGNVEGRDLFNGKSNVVVCEGFTGNVLFKMGESLYEYAESAGINDPLINRMNYEVKGGSPIIGVNGNVIVGHGISSAIAIKNMINLARDQVKSQVVKKMADALRN